MSSFISTGVFGPVLFGLALAGAYWVQNSRHRGPTD
jgi:hypothetical protein